jgi:hypothetical protein
MLLTDFEAKVHLLIYSMGARGGDQFKKQLLFFQTFKEFELYGLHFRDSVPCNAGVPSDAAEGVRGQSMGPKAATDSKTTFPPSRPQKLRSKDLQSSSTTGVPSNAVNGVRGQSARAELQYGRQSGDWRTGSAGRRGSGNGREAEKGGGATDSRAAEKAEGRC